jgi:hypothetical protein
MPNLRLRKIPTLDHRLSFAAWLPSVLGLRSRSSSLCCQVQGDLCPDERRCQVELCSLELRVGRILRLVRIAGFSILDESLKCNAVGVRATSNVRHFLTAYCGVPASQIACLSHD